MKKFVDGAGRILALSIVVVGQELNILAFIDGKPCDPVGRACHVRPSEGDLRDGLPERVPIQAIFTKVVVISIARVAMTFVARKQVRLVADFKAKQMPFRRRGDRLRLFNRVFRGAIAEVQPPNEFPSRGIKKGTKIT